MLSTKAQQAKTSAAVASARTAVDNRFRHLYSAKASIGAGDWAAFRGDTLVAEWDPKQKRTEIYHSVNGDGKTPNKSQICTINIPPMVVKGNPTLEGNAFTRSKPDALKKWVISRAKAKWRLAFSPGVVSDTLAEKWESAWPRESTPVPLAQVHADFVAELVAGQKKILRDAFRSPDEALKQWRLVSKAAGRAAVKALPEHAAKSDAEFDDELADNINLKKKVMAATIKHFVENGTLQGVEIKRDDGEVLSARFVVQSSVYKVENYGNGYDLDAKGPSDSELASTLENMPEAIRRMAMLDGGRDKRTYQMLQFANGAFAPSSPHYLLKRPTITINGEKHPDYGWDPINKSPHGHDLRSWVSISMAPRLMASDKSYGVQFTLMGKRQVAIFHQEKLSSEPASQFATGVGTGLYEESDDEGEQEPAKSSKRERATDDDAADVQDANGEQKEKEEEKEEEVQPPKRARTPNELDVDDDDMDGLFD